MPSYKKTRLAPTPSGYLHVGNILSFSVTAAIARKTGARISLRIDDLDRERMQPAFVQDIFDTLQFLDIPWDEGPRNANEFEKEYSQVYRMAIYQKALEKLRNNNELFACNCSRSQLAEEASYPGVCRDKNISLDTEQVNWRLKTTARDLQIKPVKGELFLSPFPKSMNDFIVRKKDGYPSYQLASVVDDLHYGVDLVVRGQDLWDSTLTQQYLAQQLKEPSFNNIAFYHHSLLLSMNGGKLSKSAGDTSVQYLRKQGKTSRDIFNMIGKMLGIAVPVNDWSELGSNAFPI
ncbi:MAG TPA: glutamate--tRNA ligase family protein [Chitinophagaceae bacterium]|jgi:glutamyl-tRNA synthetase|nr:glutamate--tRNA ligase family protein [Chitinophagaceae bacterium]